MSSDDDNDATRGQACDDDSAMTFPRRCNRLSNLPLEVNFGNTNLVTIENNYVDDQDYNFQ